MSSALAPFAEASRGGGDRRGRLPRDRAHARASCIPDVVVAPGLMIGATDSRHFDGVADNVYHFSPVRARPRT